MCCDEGPDYGRISRAADSWIMRASRASRLALIAELAKSYDAADAEDSQRRIESVLWAATAGDAGRWHAKSSTPGDYLARAHSRTVVR